MDITMASVYTIQRKLYLSHPYIDVAPIHFPVEYRLSPYGTAVAVISRT